MTKISLNSSLDWKKNRIGAVIEKRKERDKPKIWLIAVLNPGTELVQDVPDRQAIFDCKSLITDAVGLSKFPLLFLKFKRIGMFLTSNHSFVRFHIT